MFYLNPLSFRNGQETEDEYEDLSLSTDLHTGVNINISCLGVFLEHHSLLKHSRDGPHFLFNLTSSCCKEE